VELGGWLILRSANVDKPIGNILLPLKIHGNCLPAQLGRLCRAPCSTPSAGIRCTHFGASSRLRQPSTDFHCRNSHHNISRLDADLSDPTHRLPAAQRRRAHLRTRRHLARNCTDIRSCQRRQKLRRQILNGSDHQLDIRRLANCWLGLDWILRIPPRPQPFSKHDTLVPRTWLLDGWGSWPVLVQSREKCG